MTKERLSELINRARTTNKAVAEAIGDDPSNISWYRLGRHNIPDEKAEKIEAFLQGEIEKLLRELLSEDPALAATAKE